MSNESPSKIKCKGINQIAIVVEDLESVAENYWNILGIGPWAIFKWQAPWSTTANTMGKRSGPGKKSHWPRSAACSLSWCSPSKVPPFIGTG